MANTTKNLIRDAVGGPGLIFHLPVDGGARIFDGSLVAQLGDGTVVPYSTASSGVCIGVAQHEADNTGGADGAVRVYVETERVFCFTNGAGGDAFSEASIIGSPVYGSDDNVVADNSNSAVRKCVGFFAGMEADGKVRVFISPSRAFVINALATLTDTPATADALRDNIVASML